MRVHVCAAALLLLAACSPPVAQNGGADDHGVDLAIVAVVEAAMPGIAVTGGEADAEGEYEVAGTLNGQAYEFDLLGPDGGWRVVEIQRDIAWADAPAPVRDLIATAPNGFLPERVIESRQPAGGSIVYELFAPGVADAPTLEVRFMDGEAAIMPPAH